MSIDRATGPVRLMFADDGEFHSETIRVPREALSEYDRLVDLLREEPSVTRRLYLDPRRLAAAFVAEEE